MASTSRSAAIGNGGEERKEEQALPSAAGNGSQLRLVMPEDGHEWKKYGQKFIKNIQKNRSYFRCRHKLCGVKKRVEWHPSDPAGDLRVVYEGAHQHGSAAATSSAQGADGGVSSNQYELGAQYFGGARSH